MCLQISQSFLTSISLRYIHLHSYRRSKFLLVCFSPYHVRVWNLREKTDCITGIGGSQWRHLKGIISVSLFSYRYNMQKKVQGCSHILTWKMVEIHMALWIFLRWISVLYETLGHDILYLRDLVCILLKKVLFVKI